MRIDRRTSLRSVAAACLAWAAASHAADTPAMSSCTPAPLGDTALYLRGTMNNWTASEDHEFLWHCDAYYLNVELRQRHEFKIADAAWRAGSTFSAEGGGNHVHEFTGAHTIRLALRDGKASVSVGSKTFADPGREPVTDPVALSLMHDSRDARSKSPFGAVPAGTRVRFGLAAKPGVRAATLVLEQRRLEGNQDVLEYHGAVRVPMQQDAQGAWTAEHRFDAIGVYGYYFEAHVGDKTYVVQNNRDPVPWTREKGTNGAGTVDHKPPAHRIRRFRHTVQAPDFKVPAWAHDAVYYYVFPDRFRNGDKRNDPKPGVDRYQDKDIEFHANWLDRPYRPGSGDGSDAVFNNDFFGGDLAGIIEKLDYIAALGVNTLYMTPVFTASSNHKYDTADYRNVDPRFGSNADFSRLCQEAAQRGMRVIPDVSFNHTGADSIYFDRFGKYRSGGAFEGNQVRRDSPYADWYTFDTTQKDPDKQFKGWVGVTDLPELNKNSPSFRRFAFGSQDSITELWLDRGAAGWRMDVAPWVPDDFWREWRRAVKARKPDAVTIAETWFEASKFFLGDMFDSTMNYVFRNTVLDYAGGANAAQAYRSLELLRELYPQQALHALMNVLSTHDAARALHALGYREDTTDAARIAEAKQRLKLAVFFQMTYPGAPSIYYGDEVGVTGGDDPYNRAPYPWADLGGKPDLELLAEFKRLTALRKAHPVLRRGTLEAPLHVDDHVIVLLRRLGERWAITATNNDKTAHTVSVKLPAGAPALLHNPLTGQDARPDKGVLSIAVPPLYGSVLIGN